MASSRDMYVVCYILFVRNTMHNTLGINLRYKHLRYKLWSSLVGNPLIVKFSRHIFRKKIFGYLIFDYLITGIDCTLVLEFNLKFYLGIRMGAKLSLWFCYQTLKPLKAQIGLMSSLFVGFFGGYWVKILRSKEIDDISDDYERYTIKCIGRMFYRVQWGCKWLSLLFSTVIRRNKTPLADDFVRKGVLFPHFPFFKGVQF